MARKKAIYMSDAKRAACELDAESIAFYRRNPCIASEDLLGIRLLDAQAYMLQGTWNATSSIWCCSRNAGKTFMGADFMLLKALLYENQSIYIISSVGDQAKETFSKIEEIVLRTGKTASSIRSLKDIAAGETKKSPTNKDGFSHGSSGYHISFYNGSEIFTLNSKPDNARSRRATLVFFDEASFCSDELITVCEAFAAQNADFATDIDESYNPELERRRVPTQLVYASSQGDMDTVFYRHYKDFSKKMLAGDRNYFVCDLPCDVVINAHMRGASYPGLLTQARVDSAMRGNKDKALREYYNVPIRDGGDSQIVRWGMVRANERFSLPQVAHDPSYKYALAFDPARTLDNSIVSVMRLREDPEKGLCGDIINCVNMVDTATAKKYKLDSNRQIADIRNLLLMYNGNNADYHYIDSLLIDKGSGGGGVSTYADGLLNDWTDDAGRHHFGLIDASDDIYKTLIDKYPNAVDKLMLINPKKYKNQMVEEFIDLMKLGVINFPYEYGGQEYIKTVVGMDKSSGEEQFVAHEITTEERLALENIDLMKNEIVSINRYANADKTSITYALAKEKESRMHDDRFYTAIMLAHRLYQLRRADIVMNSETTSDFSNAPSCVSSVAF